MKCKKCGALYGHFRHCEDYKPTSVSSSGYDSLVPFAAEVKFQLGIMRNVEREISKQKRKRTQNWVLVQDYMLGNTSCGGSTSCIHHCHWMGVDPEGYTFW